MVAAARPGFEGVQRRTYMKSNILLEFSVSPSLSLLYGLWYGVVCNGKCAPKAHRIVMGGMVAAARRPM